MSSDTYDTPWEYTNRAWAPCEPGTKLINIRRDGATALLSRSGRVHSVGRPAPASPLPALRSAAPTSNPPRPPQPAIRRSKQTPRERAAATESRGVWEPRGPAADARNPAEYEVPWDQRSTAPGTQLLAARLRSSLAVSLCLDPVSDGRQLGLTYEALWEASSGPPDAALRTPRPTQGQSPPRCGQASSSASPASTSSSSSGLASGSKSSGSLSSADSAPLGLVRPYPLADFAGSPQAEPDRPASQWSSGSSTTLVKSPNTPLVETVFVSGARPAERRRDEEERERIIQRLCNDLSEQVEGRPSRRPRHRIPFPLEAPLPAPRRQPPPQLASPSNYDNVADDISALAVGGCVHRSTVDEDPPQAPMAIPVVAEVHVSPTRVPPLDLHDSTNSTCGSPEDVRMSLADEDVSSPAVAPDEYDVPWEFCNQKKLNRLLQKRAALKEPGSAAPTRAGLSLALPGFGAPPPSMPKSARSLEQSDCFHGRISRLEAERRLGPAPEGSYLVRLCESHRRSASSHPVAAEKSGDKAPEYALSLKSAAGFMHMKIQQRPPSPSSPAPHWVLGYFSSPFPSIPEMLAYYAQHKLPIKGADHMSLRYPLQDRLL